MWCQQFVQWRQVFKRLSPGNSSWELMPRQHKSRVLVILQRRMTWKQPHPLSYESRRQEGGKTTNGPRVCYYPGMLFCSATFLLTREYPFMDYKNWNTWSKCFRWSAAERDLWMMSFIIWCLAIFPSAVWHERPCKPERSTVSPHGQGCSSQSGRPSRSPTAILSTSLSSRRPHELIVYAFNQYPLPGSDAASSLALSTWVGTPFCRICWLF